MPKKHLPINEPSHNLSMVISNTDNFLEVYLQVLEGTMENTSHSIVLNAVFPLQYCPRKRMPPETWKDLTSIQAYVQGNMAVVSIPGSLLIVEDSSSALHPRTSATNLLKS